MDFEFRPYQEKLVVQVKQQLTNIGDALIEQPTGSGKTFEIVAISASLLGTKFTNIVISAPQRQIEEGFVSDDERIFKFKANNAAVSQLVVAKDFIQQSRDDGRDGSIDNLVRYLSDKADYAVVCTHAALTKPQLKDNLPESLAGYLLVIDEAHHAPADSLDQLVSIWKERGGSLLYATATPYRTDSKPVIRENMKLFRRLLAEHMEDGFAPSNINNEIIGVSVPGDVSAEEFVGNEIPESEHRKIIIDKLFEAWNRDDKPKTIIRIPPGNSTEFISELTERFSGVRILNGAGIEKSDQKRFINALKNSNEKEYDTSEYDIVVGVQRVLEGTDWAVCSHVYCVGVPSSLTMITQLIGRSLRLKKDDHPCKDSASISFFVLGATENALNNLEIKHSRHALLSCIFMADYNVGQEWLAIKPIIKGIASARKNGDLSDDKANDAENDVKDPISNDDRANVSAIIIEAQVSAIEDGKSPPTVEDLIDLISKSSDIEVDPEVVKQIIVEQLAATKGGVGDKVRDAIESKTKKYINLFPTIDKAKKEIFNEIVSEFRKETLVNSESSIGLINQIHKITGGNIREFCNRLTGNYFMSFENVREFVHNLLLKTQKEWGTYCRSGLKPKNIPTHPEEVYKNKGWISWGDFFGTEFLDFEDARKFVQSLKLKSQKEWYNYYKSGLKPKNIPSDPREVYKNKGWISWGDFLGNNNVQSGTEGFLDFKDAREFAHNLLLKTQKEWKDYCTSGLKPKNIPSDPSKVYKNKGWIDWLDWLGNYDQIAYSKSVKLSKEINIEISAKIKKALEKLKK